jgi:hypothetical protein
MFNVGNYDVSSMNMFNVGNYDVSSIVITIYTAVTALTMVFASAHIPTI